ncbi:DUF4159 domain-containing protein [Aeoliella sp.]|uniref:DUF4159 domain-containing protein n=1 Tax=Aeoliella sp. TaxID=2795800 RepID=UPI003CCBF840
MRTSYAHITRICLAAALVLAAVAPVPYAGGQENETPASETSSSDAPLSEVTTEEKSGDAESAQIPDHRQVGGEPDSVVQVANLVYAGVKSSQCFADHFLIEAEKKTSISTSRRFSAVKLSSSEIYGYPLVIMTGEGDFTLPEEERQNLRRYIERGGFLLASSGCSSQEWDRAFRREMATIFPEHPLRPLDMSHAIYHTATDIKELKAKHGEPRPIEGIEIEGRLGVAYSQDGLNDTAHTQGCCCCGGNEITNAMEVNVNILAYTLMF